jgi:hypothetical protein
MNSESNSVSELVLLPGPDRFSDRLVPGDTTMRLLSASETGWGESGVEVSLPGAAPERHRFVIRVTQVPHTTITDYCRAQGFTLSEQGPPMDRYDPLGKTLANFYLATGDGRVHCLRSTEHKGVRIGYHQKLNVLTSSQGQEQVVQKGPPVRERQLA